MAIRNLSKIFHPQSVAVIGASRTLGSVGNTVIKNLLSGGFQGTIYPINPKYDTIEDLPAFGKVADLPETPDLAVICIPAAGVPGLIEEIGAKGTRGVVIISAGFRETGAAGSELEDQILAAAAKFDGLRIIGPNCLGVMSTSVHLNASFAASSPLPGRVGFISQSGALCTSVLDWSLQKNIGFSHFISVGNMLDVQIGDLIDYMANDPHTDSIILYVESISESREFMSAARAFARQKPIIAYKAGRFAESAQAAASHTGALAGVDAVYEAAFKRAGIVRVFDSDNMFICAELLASKKLPTGDRLAIVTNAGGPGVMATDMLLEKNGRLAKLAPETTAKLTAFLPAAWSHNNPVDVLGDADPARYAEALKVTLADKEVDAALVILTPQAMTDPIGTAREVAQIVQKSPKPVLCVWMGGEMIRAAVNHLDERGVPTFTSPELAVRSFMHLVSYARNREILYETPRDMPVKFPLDRVKLRAVFNTILSEGREVLSESTSKALLEAYEIPVTKPHVAWSKNDAVILAERLGYPVVMKIFSPQITHKTDVDGVKLNLSNAGRVEAAFDAMIASAKQKRPDAMIEGVTIQKMISVPNAHELIVGAKRDDVFGTVLMVGAGGIAAEIFRDRALELPPVNERLARRMLESLRSWPLLEGYRGRKGVNVDRLIETLMRISYLVADYPEIKELDINPLLATEDDVVALDARIILDRDAFLNPPRPYSHLAIRPYPEELTRTAYLSDGTEILLRAVKPEDEPLWIDLHNNCSEQTIWFRFRYLFKETTHEMASRFCYIDYDREMALVAEILDNGERKLIGTSRLVADPDRREADYGVLVSDAYQGRGLGSILTNYSIKICKDWGMKEMVAETTPDNNRMIEIFRKWKFELDFKTADDAVLARKLIT
ncbi:bifunctional acetate--CoA ligase family protein/GNAT family N-acetyltransferase [Blastopirellula marina]|uniref:GCN5-related N-acetyltransferase n=1 Tax=Blastopirellula marina DSM 3645 TaxID=314230 RepID=A3ZSV0_9BACT|nr:bifunctional acetyl coenzyme A synthetase (ADP forming), alpha domain/GNAT family N-acetyltransferase [Blastopirellula marina]EAQ80375.1 GCN5-related N-acetyltransferase [Blastopirellula marina DSM 3645]